MDITMNLIQASWIKKNCCWGLPATTQEVYCMSAVKCTIATNSMHYKLQVLDSLTSNDSQSSHSTCSSQVCATYVNNLPQPAQRNGFDSIRVGYSWSAWWPFQQSSSLSWDIRCVFFNILPCFFTHDYHVLRYPETISHQSVCCPTEPLWGRGMCVLVTKAHSVYVSLWVCCTYFMVSATLHAKETSQSFWVRSTHTPGLYMCMCKSHPLAHPYK